MIKGLKPILRKTMQYLEGTTRLKSVTLTRFSNSTVAEGSASSGKTMVVTGSELDCSI